MSGFLRACLLTIAAGVLLILAVLGGAYYLLNHPSPLVPEPGTATGPGSTTPTPCPQAAQDLEARLKALMEGERTVLRVQVTQEEMNSLLARNLPRIQEEIQAQGAPFQVEDIKVTLEPDRLLVASRVEAFGFHPTVTVAATPSVHDGRPRIEIQEIYLGRIPLPGPIEDLLNGLLERGMERLPLQDLPLELRHIQVDQGKLILTWISRTKVQA